MKCKAHSSELRAMTKVMGGIINTRLGGASGAVEIRTDPADGLIMTANNGTMFARMRLPMLGLEEEVFCVDGGTLGGFIAQMNGEIELSTDDRNLYLKCGGRVRIPKLSVKVTEVPGIGGSAVKVSAEAFKAALRLVKYAVAKDETRKILTGVLLESDGSTLRMVSLDGFKLAMEEVKVIQADPIRKTVPMIAMQTVENSIADADVLEITLSENRVQFRTETAEIACALLAGEYPDYARMLPGQYKTRVRMRTEDLKSAIRIGKPASGKNNLIRIMIGPESMTIGANGEMAEFSARIDCVTEGEGLTIAFNQDYLYRTVEVIGTEYATMSMNSPVAPMVMQEDDSHGVHMLLPVRVSANG